MKKFSKHAHAVADEEGVWLFAEAEVSPNFLEYLGPARVPWQQIPELITWLVQQWAAHNAKERASD